MNSTILITGANRGLGLELTRQYAQVGWHVIACCRQPENAQYLTGIEGVQTIIRLDVTKPQDIKELSSQLKDKPIDIVLHNAGIYGPKAMALGQLDAKTWMQVLQVNTVAPMMVLQALIDNVAMSEKKIMAVMSSKMGSMADNSSGGSYLYRSAKAGLNAAVKSAAIDLHDQGISVVSLHPGWVQTDMGGPNALIDVQTSATGLKRILDNATLQQSGGFFDYTGASIPW